MQFNNKKYVKSFAKVFLFVYLTFLSISIFHYHSFEFESCSNYSKSAESYPYTDLTTDFFSICALHQYIQTIDNSHYSSSDIIQSLAKLDSTLLPIKILNLCKEEYTKKSPRAPPFFIS